ncbi:hypothetical protein C0Q70_16702 [Pomacea canaliculata]|uniref:Protein DEK n=1 Tax=Pomacea canaliculata TaxID=400727 RepID=A0A2T7NQL1_POMCA|nr:protein DEK-like [Pomacea canaliculata]PVD23433.1 hypothetical protein C0Q70_16702 [Pomacea canaliculata]
MSEGENQTLSGKEEMEVTENGEEMKKQEQEKNADDLNDDSVKEEEEEDEDDEPLPLGLLERPVVLTSGKREKKKVERLSMSINMPSSEKKKVEIQEGAGTKLGDCPRIEFKLGQTKAMDLKSLHRLLFNRAGSNTEVKKNIRQFSGFVFSKEDKEYEKRVTALNKMTIPQLKQICEVLDIERSGAKPVVVDRIMDFLMKPSSSGMKVPQKKKRKSKSSGEGDRKSTKRKRSPKKDSKSKAKKDTVSDISDSDEEEEENEDEEEEEKEKELSEEEEESDKEPPKKKPKTVKKPVKKENAKAKKQNGKQEKPIKKEKKETRKKSGSEDDSDDEPLASKKDEPPSNDELKEVIKKILDGANLEEVTMKTVVKQVYDKYPSFDLTDRKDFIKATVKQIIS